MNRGHYIGECRIYTQDQVEELRWGEFFKGALAGAGITLLTLYGPQLWNAWLAWTAVDVLR